MAPNHVTGQACTMGLLIIALVALPAPGSAGTGPAPSLPGDNFAICTHTAPLVTTCTLTGFASLAALAGFASPGVGSVYSARVVVTGTNNGMYETDCTTIPVWTCAATPCTSTGPLGQVTATFTVGFPAPPSTFCTGLFNLLNSVPIAAGPWSGFLFAT